MGLYLGYIRVSRVGKRSETLISPELQERQILGWGKTHGHEIDMLPPELDQSGGKDERPILEGGIEQVERGERRGVVVWNFARFTRGGLASSIRFLEKIEGVGGELHSTSQPIDSKTPQGRMQRNIHFSIDQAEREQKAEELDRVKADAIDRGVWTAPHVPIGYLKNDDRKLVVDPAASPVVAEAFRRRGAGASWREVAEYISVSLDRPCSGSTAAAIVRSRTYLGEARQGEHANLKAHEPIVDRATWEAAQLNMPKPARGNRGEALATGLVRCAGCSLRMSTSFRNGRRYYNCRRYHSAGDCPEPASMSAKLLEPYVVDAVFAHVEQIAYTSSERTSAVELAERSLDEAEAELVLYQESVRLTDVGAEHFAAGMKTRAAAVEEARRALAKARLASPRVLPGTLAEVWPDLSVVERRQVLGSALSVVWVRRGRADVAARVRLISAEFEPPGLSVQGRPGGLPAELATLPWDGDLEGEIRVASMEDGGQAASGAAL
jgi:DNA invertase Pin-like site-specific DNA recombinase